ncbi:MAG: HAMP domain-containing protein, partial [Acidobacteriota bacterium]
MAGRSIKYHSFRKDLLILLACVMGVLVAGVVAGNGYLLDTVITEFRESQIRSMLGNVRRTLLIQDRAYYLYENMLDERMRAAMRRFQEAYSRSGGDLGALDLSALRLPQDHDIDFFVIDGANVVVLTTFEKDLGLNIAESGTEIAGYLEKVRRSGEYATYRATVSRYDGIKKFAYQPAEGGRHLLEVGVSLTRHSASLAGVRLETVPGDIRRDNDMLLSVHVFSSSGISFTSGDDGKHFLLGGERREAMNRALAAGQAELTAGDGVLYRYFQLAPTEGAQLGKVVEIAVDTAKLRGLRNGHLLILLGVGLVCVAGGLAASHWLARRFSRPLLQLSAGVHRIAEGHLDEPVEVDSANEIGLLASDVEAMRVRIAGLVSRLEATNQELLGNYDLLIRAFLKALEHRESGTAAHSLRVNRIAMAIGEAMELEERLMTLLDWGSLLHDIGKLTLSNALLLKPGSLTAEEYECVKRHPSLGFEVLHELHYLGGA